MSAVMERPAIGWSPAHTATARRAAEAREARAAWGQMRPCAWCYGQRRILRPSPNGEGLVPTVCERCEGIGMEVAR